MYCEDILTSHELASCFTVAGQNALAILYPGHDIVDWTDEAEWAAAIAAGTAIIVCQINADYAPSGDVTADNPVGCGPDSIPIDRDWTANLSDGNMTANNVNFWCEVNKSKPVGVAFYSCKANLIKVVEANLTFNVNGTAPRTGLDTFIGTITWRSICSPQYYVAPVDIFNCEA